MKKSHLAPLGLVIPIALNGCGLAVPEKDLFSDDGPINEQGRSRQGALENKLLAHIACEIEEGIWRAYTSGMRDQVAWLFYKTNKDGTVVDAYGKTVPFYSNGKPESVTYKSDKGFPGWGVAVYLQMQIDEQTQVAPGVGLNEPFHNAYAITAGPTSVPWTMTNLLQPPITAIPRFFSLGVGATGAARASRQEAVQFTVSTPDLWKNAMEVAKSSPDRRHHCPVGGDGVQIDSNLKIDDFIFDQITTASSTNFSSTDQHGFLAAPFNTFQETITFIALYSFGVTPAWKFARASVDPNTPTASIQRDHINTLIITLGPMSALPKDPFKPISLDNAGQNQHQAATAAALIGNANRSVAP